MSDRTKIISSPLTFQIFTERVNLDTKKRCQNEWRKTNSKRVLFWVYLRLMFIAIHVNTICHQIVTHWEHLNLLLAAPKAAQNCWCNARTKNSHFGIISEHFKMNQLTSINAQQSSWKTFSIIDMFRFATLKFTEAWAQTTFIINVSYVQFCVPEKCSVRTKLT